jgi:hypothetical protein
MDPNKPLPNEGDLFKEMLKRLERLSRALAEQAAHNKSLEGESGGPEGPATPLLSQIEEIHRALCNRGKAQDEAGD